MTDTLPPVRGLSFGGRVAIQTPITNVPTLSTLSLSANEFIVGAQPGTLIGNIFGATVGSTVMLDSSITGAVQLVSGAILVGPTPPEVSGVFDIMIVEILNGATNSPNITTIQIIVIDITPTIISGPLVLGTPFAGTPITAIDAVWNGNVRVLIYQWQVGGINATGVGATTLTYTPVTGDVGQALTIIVTASNLGGTSAPATSAPSIPVVAPVIPPDGLNIGLQISVCSLPLAG